MPSESRLMFATIYLPDFYLQAALRHQPELAGQPVALLDDQEKKAVLTQLNATAEELGVRRGMTPSQGLARSLALLIKVRNHAQEKMVQEILLHLAGTLSPYVEATAPGLAVHVDPVNDLRVWRQTIAGIAPTV